MTLSLIAFILSGLGIIALVGFKMLQERLGLLLFWPDTRNKIEVTLKSYTAKYKAFVASLNRRTMYIVIHYSLTHMRSFFSYLQNKIDRKLVHLVNLIKGKRVIDQRGSASDFLHDINHFKESFRRQ